MSDGILFLVLPERDVARLQEFVRRSAVPAKRDRVQIFSDAISSSFSTDVKSRTAREIIERISLQPNYNRGKLVIGHETNCAISELLDWWRSSGGSSHAEKAKGARLERTVKEHLESQGIHWHSHALAEIEAYDGQRPNLQAWLQQFGELGFTDIGRKIAAKLRVIRTSKLPNATFARRASDTFGHRQAGCYVEDADPGGSWVEMQTHLMHRWPAGTVHSVKWNMAAAQLIFPECDVDEFVIHEDGLWSGTETVQRLRAIQAAPPRGLVTFRFGIVTDFGLMVARHAIRRLDLVGRASIDASASELIEFLNPGLPEHLHYGLKLEINDYFKELHQHVGPLAFRPGEDWTLEEMQFCRSLGRQLAHGWLSHSKGKAPEPEKVELFALGGGGFASTVSFSRSVPKVCLPLLWLDGDVTHMGKSLRWKPLFLDARRVTDERLLLSP